MAHPPEPPEHGTEHVTDDHGHDSHGHGHGHGVALPFPIIPEDSGADKFLVALAFFALLGWFTFATIMLTTMPHETTEHASPGQDEAPKAGAPPDHAGTSEDHGNQAAPEHD